MVFIIRSKDISITNSETESKWRPILLSFIGSLPFFTYGIESTTLKADVHAGHFIVAPDDVPWTATAFILGAIFAAPVYCYMIDKIGRKIGIFCVNLLQGASCVPLFLPPSDTSVIVLHALSGISTGGLFTVVPIYIREISSNKNRGLALSLIMVMTSLGYMMKFAMDEKILAYLILGLVTLQIILLVFVLETPSYLVKAGKFEKAKMNIAKLKSLDENGPNVLGEISDLRDESDRARAKGNLSIITILKNTIWRDASKIGVVLNTVTVLCGSIIFLDQQKTLMQLKMNVAPDNLLVPVCTLLGAVFCTILIRFTERKYLLTFAFAAMVMSMGILAVYTQADLTVTSLRWLPVVALGFLVFSHGILWGLPTIVMVEILNFEIRATLLPTFFVYSQLIKLAHVHTIKYIEDYMGIYTTFYIFAFINIFGTVYSLFSIPNLNNKNVRQIERQLKRIPLIKL